MCRLIVKSREDTAKEPFRTKLNLIEEDAVLKYRRKKGFYCRILCGMLFIEKGAMP